MSEASCYIGIRTFLSVVEVRERLYAYLRRIAKNQSSSLGSVVSGLRIEEGKSLTPGAQEKFVFIGILGVTALEEGTTQALPSALLSMLTDTGLIDSPEPKPDVHYFWPMRPEQISGMTKQGSLPIFLSVERGSEKT